MKFWRTARIRRCRLWRLTVSALSTETIKAGVGAGTVGLAIATGTAISFAGSGVFTQNEIAIGLKAYIDATDRRGRRCQCP